MQNPNKEATIRKLMLGIVGAAAVAASLLLMRQQKQSSAEGSRSRSGKRFGVQ